MYRRLDRTSDTSNSGLLALSGKERKNIKAGASSLRGHQPPTRNAPGFAMFKFKFFVAALCVVVHAAPIGLFSRSLSSHGNTD